MNKPSNKKTNQQNDPETQENLSVHTKNYVTPEGYAKLQNELHNLLSEERPKIVETVRWAASNGDRSENADYIYGKRRLREIDRRIRYLTKQIQTAEVVDPNQQRNLTKVFFGATVTYSHADGTKKSVKIVGIDEADLSKNKISWISPVAKALMKSEIGDMVKLHTPQRDEKLKILAIKY